MAISSVLSLPSAVSPAILPSLLALWSAVRLMEPRLKLKLEFIFVLMVID
jgi:hypothetical protein